MNRRSVIKSLISALLVQFMDVDNIFKLEKEEEYIEAYYFQNYSTFFVDASEENNPFIEIIGKFEGKFIAKFKS